MKKTDFNLLAIFDAIMIENSIIGAAKRLSMTQPAVSNAVMRMRLTYNNPLFVKKGRGIEPTAYALNLWSKIHEPINILKNSIDPVAFSPANNKRRFRIAIPDILVDLVWLPLRKLIEKEAPGLDILAVPLNLQGRERILIDGKADLVISAGRYLNRVDRKSVINNPLFVCAMRKDHPLSQKKLTLKNFLAAEHLLVTSGGDDWSYVDEILNNKGHSRRISMTTNHYSIIPKLIKETNLITVIDELVFAEEFKNGEIVLKAPPIDFEDISLCIAWHARHDNDKMLYWLKEKMIAMIKYECETARVSMHG